MEKTIRNYFIVGIICVFVGSGITTAIAGRQLRALRESEKSVVSSLAELERQSKEFAAGLATVRTKLDSCTSAVTAVQGSVQQLDGKIQNLGTVVGAIKSDIGQVTARQSDFSAELSRFSVAISGLGQSIYDLAEPISAATAGVQHASGELSGADEIINTVTGIIQGLPSAGQGGTK
jgi:chromosome segregation ATPase